MLIIPVFFYMHLNILKQKGEGSMPAKRTIQKNPSMLSSILCGVLGTGILFVMIGLLHSWLIMKGYFSESMYQIPASFGIAISVCIGTAIASLIAQNNILIIGALTAFIELALLFLLNVLLFKGSFQNIASVIILVPAGAVIGCLIAFRIINRKTKKSGIVKLYKKSRR